MRAPRRAGLAAVLCVTGALAVAATATARLSELGGDFRISTTGVDGDISRDAGVAALAHNRSANEYLVVWEADGLPANNEIEIFGQRLSAAGGDLGPDFRISNVGSDGDARRDAARPAVAHNPTANEYFVVWEADALATDDEFEVFGQRFTAGGVAAGPEIRISTTGADGDPARTVLRPKVAYNPAANEYLVVWEADALATDEEFEIFGQRLSGTGTPLGPDFRISNTRDDGNATRDGRKPGLAYNPVANEYLVVWRADRLATNNEDEIFGQRLSASGGELGAEFRVSNVGTDGDPSRGASRPRVAHNPRANEYLVAWEGDGGATDNALEVYGQRLTAAGDELGLDFRISNVGGAGDATRDAFFTGVAYDRTADEYLAIWREDGLATDGEFEVFGQRISSVGDPLGVDFRISSLGTDGDAVRDAFNPALAYNPGSDQYLVTWHGDGLAADNEMEVFGQRLDGPTPAPPPPRCLGRRARIVGDGDDEVLRGTPGNDVIVGLGGEDVIRGGGGRDRLCGGRGADELRSGVGGDRLKGGGGRDVERGGAGRDELAGNAGRDDLNGGRGRDRLRGGPGRDACVGGDGRDRAAGCERRRSIP
jgi:Ca2+-binding RTX toxin-like protein